MTRVRVTSSQFEGSWLGKEYDDAEIIEDDPFAGEWHVDNKRLIFAPDEVRVLGKHEGEYNPNHIGEMNPDWWDRQSYDLAQYGQAQRHLLHTGVE